MADGFFKHIPNIEYDFKSDGKFFVAKDLFRKVSTWSYLQEGVTGYSYYRITEGARPDVVAATLYGDSTLYWTFFLVNENLQDLNDWPKGNLQFTKFMDRKYPGTCLEASSSTDIVSYDHSKPENEQVASRKFILGEKVSQSSSVYGFITDINPTHKRITLNSVIGNFTADSTATGADSGKSFTISSVVSEQNATHHYTTTLSTNDIAYELDTAPYQAASSEESYPQTRGEVVYESSIDDPLWPDGSTKYVETTGAEIISHTFKTTVSTGNTEVTNLDYERELNEDKHEIRYIQPAYLGKVVREFRDLVRD